MECERFLSFILSWVYCQWSRHNTHHIIVSIFQHLLTASFWITIFLWLDSGFHLYHSQQQSIYVFGLMLVLYSFEQSLIVAKKMTQG